MIGYAIWDQTSLISDAFLRQYIRDTFYEITLDFDNVQISHDLNVLLDNSYDHLVVFGSGHVTKNSIQLKIEMERFCQRDFLIAGHIIHHVNTYPFLHPQTIVINMNRYREFGCPMVGFFEESEVLDLHKPQRSPENIHDNYTPIWLKPTQELFSCVSRKFGWSLIHTSLNKGIPVLNFPYVIRQSKQYLYQNDKPHSFSKCLQKLAKDELKIVPANLNGNQRTYLTSLLAPGVDCRVFLMNTESLFETVPLTPIKRIFGPASGFKLFLLWNKFGETAEPIYYDHNKRSLEVWQDIVENWSGREFHVFCVERGYVDDFSKMQSIIDTFGEDNLEETWQRFQQSNPRFIHCDIIRNPQPLLDELLPDGNYVWYSNIFKFFESIRCYGMAGTDLKEQQFLKLLFEKPDTYCSSSTYSGTVKDAITT